MACRSEMVFHLTVQVPDVLNRLFPVALPSALGLRCRLFAFLYIIRGARVCFAVLLENGVSL